MNHTRKWFAAPVAIASSMLFANSALGAIVLLDFGNNNTFRGASVPNPDPNGNYWNSLQTGVFYQNLVDTKNTPTAINFGFSSGVGTDSYNGPAGDTSAGTPASHVADTDIDAAALGILGVKEAAFDFVTNPSDGVPLRLEIQQLDPTQFYKLTFFGSHKYNAQNTTRYSIFSDASYATLVASVDLVVGVDAAHNRDQVAVLNHIFPQAGNILFVQVDGAGSGTGYLNSLALESIPEPSAAIALMGGGSLLLGLRRRRSQRGAVC